MLRAQGELDEEEIGFGLNATGAVSQQNHAELPGVPWHAMGCCMGVWGLFVRSSATWVCSMQHWLSWLISSDCTGACPHCMPGMAFSERRPPQNIEAASFTQFGCQMHRAELIKDACFDGQDGLGFRDV